MVQVVVQGQAMVLHRANRELLANILSKPELIQHTFSVTWHRSFIVKNNYCSDPLLYPVCGFLAPTG